MAFTPNSALQSTPPTILKDWRHAANLFNVDQFRLAPKSGFLFHVAFGINQGALQNINLVQRYGQEINMLVKGVDLPSFTIQTETLNQYNRKKNVQNQVKYGEISIKFHDDNMGLINQLWQNYFTYYYADSRSANTAGAYSRNATTGYSSAMPTPYGFDNGSTQPFFNYIKIYQMARHEYVCYQLYNPIATNWNYNKVSYSDQGVHDFDMKIVYEAVSFSQGAVEAGTPEGFGLTHYDTTPSSLTGITTPSDGGPSFVQSTDTNALAPGILANAINSVNQNQNTSGGLGIGNLVAGTALVGAGIAAFNALGGISGISSAVSGAVSGIKDTLFPSSDKNASDSQSTDNPATTDQTKDDSPAPTTQEDQPASPSSDDAAPLNTQDGTGTPSDPGNDGWGEG